MGEFLVNNEEVRRKWWRNSKKIVGKLNKIKKKVVERIYLIKCWRLKINQKIQKTISKGVIE